MMKISVKRVYEPAVDSDGYRVLVDRLWPRGVKKDSLNYDEWCKDIAPSADLRNWFHKDSSRFDEFAVRYQAELENSAAPRQLLKRAGKSRLTLLYAAKDEVNNHARVLKEYMERLARA